MSDAERVSTGKPDSRNTSSMRRFPIETTASNVWIPRSVAASASSLIDAIGDLTVGNASSSAGFSTHGTLQVVAGTLTLLDADQAVLGGLTTLGNGVISGALQAPRGLVLDPGDVISGFGTLNTPNDASMTLINNGSIRGEASRGTFEAHTIPDPPGGGQGARLS